MRRTVGATHASRAAPDLAGHAVLRRDALRAAHPGDHPPRGLHRPDAVSHSCDESHRRWGRMWPMITRPCRAALIVLAWALAILAGPSAAPVDAQGGPTDLERYFRVEWEPEAVARGGWAVEGYVYSTHPYRVNGVRLSVEILDDAGEVQNRVFGWVPGDVPSG